MPNKADSASATQNEQSTKQKILTSSAGLFASKGFTETTTRELADAVGLNVATLYYHFPSKNAILENLFEDYLDRVWGGFSTPNILSELRKNPTADGIMALLTISNSDEYQDYYLNVLEVLLQEQHRNPLIRQYVAKEITDNEGLIGTIIDTLIELNIIRDDTDADFWQKTASSLMYAYSNRLMLGIGDNSKDYSGKTLNELLRDLFALLLSTCAI